MRSGERTIDRAYRCAGCGYRSRTADFFRREKAGWRHADFCRTCEPAPIDRDLARSLAYMAINGLIGVGAGLIGGPYLGVAHVWTFLALLLPATVIAAVVHETGHLLAARAVGARVYHVRLGGGRIVWRRQFGDLTLEVHGNPVQGGAVLCHFPPGQWSRWKRACILLAGGGAELLAAGLLAVLFIRANAGADPAPLLLTALFTQALVMVFSAVANLSPIEWSKGPEPSDGRQLWSLHKATGEDPASWAALEALALVRSGQLAEAAEHCRRGWEADPQQGFLLGLAAHAIGATQGAEAAVAYFLAQRHRIPDDAGEPPWPFAFGNAAWHMVKAGRPEWAALARDLSARAFAVSPDDPPIAATEGAVRLWNGDPDGEALILQMLPRMHPEDDKAEFCEVLGRWRIADGDTAEGQEFLRLARHLRGNAARVRGRRLLEEAAAH